VSSRQVGLHVHSEFSTLDGFSSVGDIARRAKELGQSAVALTDHGECAGHYKFQKACQSQGVQPIFGMEGYWHHDIASLREAKRYPKDLSHLCLLAKDQKGLSNLWALSTIAYDRQHHYYRPIADPELLRTYAEGIYASDGCMMTGLGRAVEASDEDGVRRYITTLLDIFGDRFYIELHTWQFMEATTDEQRRLNQLMTDINAAKLRMANALGIPFVVVNDCHHSWPQDWKKKDLANQINKDKGDQVAEGQKADHHMGEDELLTWMARHGISRSVVEQGIDNAWEIAQSCTAEITPMLEMPTYAKDVDEDAQRFLAAIEEGFRHKVLDNGLDAEKYYQRLEFEAQEILSRRFGGYFLTVADYVRAAKDGSWKTWVEPGAEPEPVLTGPGRGSAGGSLVSWLMGITGLDPIKYDLLFERFLAPGRKGFPDIDVDFPQSKLRDMFHYLEARHGEGHVCTLSTTGRNGAKGMLKDLGRAMGIPFSDTNQITNIIEQAAAIVAAERENLDEDSAEETTWDEVLSTKGGDLSPWAKKYPEMFEQLGEMVGVVRNYGKHASGVLINNQPLLGVIPMRTRNHGAVDEIATTQWDMYDIEELGGVKFDLLGLRHLDTLGAAARLVAERQGVTLDFESFGDEQYSDPAIWEHIAEGRTTGIFQIETPGTTRTAVEMKPVNELDVAALVSIIRPGVKDAGETDRYLKRRAGIEPVVYDHPMLEPIVSETYGVLVYQEQMMRAAKDLAGYDPGEVDDLRKAIGKKLADKIAVHESKFRDGCLANPAFMESFDGNTRAAEKTVAKIWASINASGKYAFNKCAVGSTLVRLSASSQHTDGTMPVGDMWHRLHDLAAPGTAKVGDPCRFCGRPAVKKGRGQCSRCLAWRMKFRNNHPKMGLRAWSLGDDGRLHPNRIIDVHQNGVQPVWRVTLEDGRSITTTANHRHMTPEGWREVWELEPGDQLLVCGEYEVQQWEPEKVRTTIGHRAPKALAVGDVFGLRPGNFINGGHSMLRDWTESQEWVCSEEGCERSRANGDRIERAHLDGDRTNNHPSNLAMKCASHHKAYDYQINGRRRRGAKGYPAIPTRIVSIEYAGQEMTYDLEMADPYHSWVGNDIVTHNSHAVGYGLVSVWETWLAHHYPNEYIVELMATDSKNINRYVRVARRRGIPILPPDVNISDQKFTIGPDGIRYGLDTIRGVGSVAVRDILAKRPFTSLADYLERVDPRHGGGKTVVTNLISIGAFDTLEYNPAWDGKWAPSCRSRLMQEFHEHRVWTKRVSPNVRAKMSREQRAEHLMKWFAKHRTDKDFDKEFGVPNFDDSDVVYRIEQELVGNYVLVDPMAPYLSALDELALRDPSQINDFTIGEVFVIGGQVSKIKQITTKRGKEMAFLTVDYNEAEFEITVFPESYAQLKLLLREGAPVACTVIRDERGCHLASLERLDILWRDAG
jgi:DNA polymerase III subunit alpha